MPSGQRFGVEVRGAAPGDAPEISRLLAQTGAVLTPGAAADRLEAMRERTDCAVLVTSGWSGLNGLVAVGWAPLLQQPRPVARITALVVDEDERRHGIGRLLLKAASKAARTAGCDILDVAVPDGQGALAAFCLATGFAQGETVFARSLRRRAEG